MSQWLLLENFAGSEGRAVELQPAALEPGGRPIPFTPGPEGKAFDIVLFCHKDPSDIHSRFVVKGDLERSVTKSGRLAYSLLYEEGLERCQSSARFQLPEAANISGYSGDLLFALAVITAALPRKDGYPSLAATGRLDDDGHVRKVRGVPSKLKSALAVLPPGGLFFYPRVNDEAIDPELRVEAQRATVRLVAVENLDEAVGRLGVELTESWRGNPYRGFGVFTAEHSRIFFGRHSDVTSLKRELLERESAGGPGIVILGSSGRGKSSLVQAGLLPALEQKLIDRPIFSALWRPVQAEHLTTEEIAVALRSIWSRVPELVALSGFHDRVDSRTSDDATNRSAQKQALPSDPPAGVETTGPLAILAEDLSAALPYDRRFVFVIDQMEELFRPAFSPEAREEFGAFLGQLQRLGVWAIATLRSEYFHAYQQSNLLEVFGDGYTLRPLNATALELVIRKPAELRKLRFGVRSEDRHDLALQLRDDALKEGGDNVLPLLQFILSELYQHRDQENGLLTVAAYDLLGGLAGVVGRYATNQLLEKCSLGERKALPEVLVHLIRLSEDGIRPMRERASLQQFPENSDQLSLVNKLIKARLLTSDSYGSDHVDHADRKAFVELVHDCLLTTWEPVVQTIENYKEMFDQRRRLDTAVKHWLMEGKSRELLLADKNELIKSEIVCAFFGLEQFGEYKSFINASKSKLYAKGNSLSIYLLVLSIVFAHDLWSEDYWLASNMFLNYTVTDKVAFSILLSAVSVTGIFYTCQSEWVANILRSAKLRFCFSFSVCFVFTILIWLYALISAYVLSQENSNTYSGAIIFICNFFIFYGFVFLFSDLIRKNDLLDFQYLRSKPRTLLLKFILAARNKLLEWDRYIMVLFFMILMFFVSDITNGYSNN